MVSANLFLQVYNSWKETDNSTQWCYENYIQVFTCSYLLSSGLISWPEKALVIWSASKRPLLLLFFIFSQKVYLYIRNGKWWGWLRYCKQSIDEIGWRISPAVSALLKFDCWSLGKNLLLMLAVPKKSCDHWLVNGFCFLDLNSTCCLYSLLMGSTFTRLSCNILANFNYICLNTLFPIHIMGHEHWITVKRNICYSCRSIIFQNLDSQKPNVKFFKSVSGIKIL